ncbi:hypothetical protein N7468_009693 [Penicillium chermesinum]|uniref:Subtelomeric hrmA-associated cluster protein AFUB-079030/YDR124W-like helical bundle domain-containing protein n=1 Tax=Penicillium chermesinum TaxID=63820 RepID=A0A9W9TFI4_9EURO|nr:uncharacterized protein N7468_009693 [Penicillium chermesinum]KAJ5220489.1 hypothetical protein N7468_009693 [Penicillium chermesinum]
MTDETRNPPYRHFALIYIDDEGYLRQEASPSIAVNGESIISSRVRNAFLGAVANSSENIPSRQHGGFPVPTRCSTISTRDRPPFPRQSHRRPSRSEPNTSERDLILPRSNQETSSNPDLWQSQQGRRYEWSQPPPQSQITESHPAENLAPPTERAQISVRDRAFLWKYYETAFKKLQQINCRIIAKVYIKLVEPRKQVNYPYNGRRLVNGRTQQLDPSETRPPWWPPERIILLIHLLCELHKTHGITAQKLKAADQPIRRQIAPPERLRILDEIYRVRQEEENYIDGVTDGKALVTISRENLPSPFKSSESSERIEQAFVEQHRGAETISSQVPPSQGIHTQKSPVSPDYHFTPNITSFSPSGFPGPSSVPLNPAGGQVAAAAASLPKDRLRKRHIDGPGFSDPISPTSTGFSDAAFGGAEAFIPPPYSQPAYLHPSSIATTIPSSMAPFGGAVDPYTLDYFFNDQCQSYR